MKYFLVIVLLVIILLAVYGYKAPVANPAQPTPVVIVQPGPQPTAQPGQPKNEVAKQLDDFFGAGNWRPFPDRKDGVKAQWPKGKPIGGIIGAVDSNGKPYTTGQVPPEGECTAWLTKPLP